MNEKKNVKILPYGNSNFKDIMLNNYAYVDKTRYIEMLEKESNRNQLFIRPRKFGKSLFLHTLMCYYDMNEAENFDRLFGNLYIGKHPT
ncbi:MAG: AAA family ATPase, partial [Dysgonamonadaceae bacterium]|nr:AAA family ATPase [Dysgonamonadaceae bacterium]